MTRGNRHFLTHFSLLNPKMGFRKNKKGSEVTSKPLQADKARFELAEAFTSHAFEACSLDRSDTYPCCQNGNLFIMPHSADLANRSFAEQVSSVCRLRHVRSQSRNSPEALALRLRAKHSDRNYIHSIIALIRELADPPPTPPRTPVHGFAHSDFSAAYLSVCIDLPMPQGLYPHWT